MEDLNQKDSLTQLAKKLGVSFTPNTAQVRYVGNLTDNLKTSLTSRIRETFSDVEEIVFTEDADLIGGLVVEYKDYVYDASVKGTLRKLITT